jgi:hypothetical protein
MPEVFDDVETGNNVEECIDKRWLVERLLNGSLRDTIHRNATRKRIKLDAMRLPAALAGNLKQFPQAAADVEQPSR